MARDVVSVGAALALALALCAAAAGGRANTEPLSLAPCLMPNGHPPDDALAVSCLHGVFPGRVLVASPTLPPEPCVGQIVGRCPEWLAVLDDPAASGRSDQFPAGMDISPDGLVTVVAAKNVDFNEADPYSSTSSWAVVAYDTATGTERWRSVYRSGGPYDAPGAVTFSPDGRRVYATGESYTYGNPLVVPNNAVMTTIAYDSAGGVQLWRASYDVPEGLDNGRAVVASPDGTQVYVAGVSNAGQYDLDYVTAAYSASTGQQLWAKRYTGLDIGGVDSPFALGVDPYGGYVYVTGWSAGSAEFDIDYGTVAYAISGETASEAWSARYDGVEADLPDEAFALAVDPAGPRVYVTGLSVGLQGATRTYEYGTVAYDAGSGGELWRARWNGPGSGFNSATAVAVDPAGARIFVTGQSASPTASRDSDVGTVAYAASSGAELWARQDGEPTYDGEFTLSIAASPNGSRVYATGVSSSSRQQGLGDELTIAYGAADGVPAWKARLNATGLDHDIGTVVQVTPDGRRVITSGRLTHGVDLSGNVYDVGTASYREETPTAAFVTLFAVHGRMVTWQTRTETALLGFELRRDGRKLTRGLIPARGRTSGALYRFVDRTAHPGRAHVYRLTGVGLDGARLWTATARVKPT